MERWLDGLRKVGLPEYPPGRANVAYWLRLLKNSDLRRPFVSAFSKCGHFWFHRWPHPSKDYEPASGLMVFHNLSIAARPGLSEMYRQLEMGLDKFGRPESAPDRKMVAGDIGMAAAT